MQRRETGSSSEEKTVEAPDRHGDIVEVRGLDGEPPYLVRFSEGHESILFPGTDFMIEHIEPRSTGCRRVRHTHPARSRAYCADIT
ncbi:DUF1918 domain-containing protein [Cryobacterium sp. TMT2-42-4]|uniref:DUF1918 domain-containing protein n=1 Tax=unclassified Cryobacterium TaxID=2649013 RepID=UPI00321FAB44